MEIECTGDVNLNDINSQYRLLFECALDVILLLDLSGNILDANHAAVGSYGYTKDELRSMNGRDLRIPSERGLAAKQLDEAYTEGRIFETVHQRKDGSTFPVEVSARGIVMGNKKILISIVRDITKRKKY
jgi:PAS domain S-box-containing protein